RACTYIRTISMDVDQDFTDSALPLLPFLPSFLRPPALSRRERVRGLVRSPALSWRRYERRCPATVRPDPSIPSGGWPRAPHHCRRGSTRKKESGRASTDLPGTCLYRRTPAVVRCYRGEMCWSADG